MDLKNLNKDRKERRAKAPLDLANMVYGKIPPQAKDIESAVLGAIMLEKHAFDATINIINWRSFYSEANQLIYKAMQGLALNNRPIETLTVVEELTKREQLELVGGPYYVVKLTNSVVSSASIEYHCHIIQEKFVKREMIRLGGELISESYSDGSDTIDVMNDHEKAFTELSNMRVGDNTSDIDTALSRAMNRIEDLKAKDESITGINTGFFELNRITHGWQDTDLIILAARPSVGKTAFSLNIARHAFMNPEKPVPVAFFSLEMSTGQLTNRLLSAESEVWLEKIQTGKMDDSELKTIYKNAVEKMAKGKLFIDDTAALDILALKSKCRRLKRKHNIGLIIIDYLQLMTGDNKSGNREQEISRISRELKGLAKELNVPVIALSQLSRKTEERKGDAKMPQLSDLRESGAIEQDADMVMFLYRPEYYDITANEFGESTKGLTYLSIAKHRNGSLAMGHQAIKLKAELHIQKFRDWDSMDDVKAELGKGTWKPVIGPGSKLSNSDEDAPF